MLGLQLYTVREHLAADPPATLTAIRDAGYAHVECMDVEQVPTLRPLCDDLGLAIRGSFYNWGLVTGNAERIAAALPEMAPRRSFAETLDLAAAHGLTHVVFGYLLPFERGTVADYQRLCEHLNRAGEAARARGLQHAYHHHSFEFAPLDAAGTRGWDVLLRELDPALTPFEADVFWLRLGGQNPVTLLREHADRVRLLHLKDVAPDATPDFDEAAVPAAAFRDVGAGALDFPALLAAAGEVDYVAVERDLGPDRLAGAARSAGFLLEGDLLGG